jgi:hypothetical protein
MRKYQKYIHSAIHLISHLSLNQNVAQWMCTVGFFGLCVTEGHHVTALVSLFKD